ncbi:hypothetical protein [Streptomyces sp. VRA16 Mangrove soil]|uniref:hypothetical protein n=1 Tax=Streptomyces sp. VRA16 Mangrove soil TaxID=2817434 RepID=UPI001A9D4B5F|nr:hypothetical protein [Streptomyces sp. VRA16 Mangrove soil]MBO1332994.1 hypothetical protein [Streptomyces sp. VRA16 Mangrove soil]
MRRRRVAAGCRALGDYAARPHVLFGGVYGAVLASSMVAALTRYGQTARADRLYDAAWLLITALASALAHGYAHLIARRGDHTHHGVVAAIRVLLQEWPLLLATAPTMLILLGSGLGWWYSQGIEYVAFTFNVVLLFAWGLLAARAGGRTWLSAGRIGAGDALLGVLVVVANAVIK